MILLKQLIHFTDTNSVEATWVDRTALPDLDVPAVEAVFGVEGNIVTPAVEAHTIINRYIDVQVKCHSYSDRQMDMLRADLGADAADYADLIAEVEANQVSYPEPTPEQITSDAKAKLREIDIASIRALREYVAAQPDAPKIIKDKEAAAAAERGKLR